MKIFNLSVMIMLVALGFSCTGKQEHNKLTDQEKKDGWKLLFDGKTTNGWRNYKKPGISGWTVKDGLLINSGVGSDHGGDIITEEQFGSFELYLEWKIDKESNSGIFYHVVEGDNKAVYQTGPEYQLLDDKGWPTKLDDSQYSGANYAMHKPVGAKVKPLNEFNETKIIVNGAHVEHWLNGVKVVNYELWTDEWKQKVQNCKWKDHKNYGLAQKGHIALQDHGGKTVFRNIKIRKL